MTFNDSWNFSRAVTGLTGFDQYSIPVPSGNAISSRPFDITSSIAYSSASRFGSMKFGGTPQIQILAFLICGISAAATTFGVAIMLYTVLWCSFRTIASKPSLSASTSCSK